jgi:carboxyl-terminal processing protease
MDDRNTETEIEEKNKNGGFIKGLIAGACTVVAVAAITFCICHFGFGITFSAVRGSVGQTSAQTVLDSDTITKINELTAYIGTYYYEDVDVDDLQEGLFEGLLSGVGDKYAAYFDAESYSDYKVSTTKEYYGIGAGLIQYSDTMEVEITKVYEDTPAEAAGLLEGDYVISADDVLATSMELTDFVQIIRGDKGTTVHLEVYRPDTDENLSFDVEREVVTLPTVSGQMLDDNIGYVSIGSFASNTATEFEEVTQQLFDEGMEAMIIDIRNNTGGIVDAVVKILDDILPEGVVVYTEDKNGNRQDYTSDGSTYMDIPITVLVNGSSASASEILAGAIKDYDYGTLIGTTTYGKGIVQTVFTLSDGDAVRLTTAKYFTPNGNYIHGVGIEPDIELEYEYLDPDGEEYDMQYDNQIQKAIEVLREEM